MGEDGASPVQTPAAQLSLRGVEFAYGHVPVLFGVTAEVRAGEMVVLVGTNGAGKSTLLRLMAGLERPTAGAIAVEGEDLGGGGPQHALRRGVVLVPENKAIFPDMTVAENLEMSAYTVPKREVATRVAEAVEVFPRLRERLRQQAGSMSGGEKQMLSIAKALLLRPKILLIDELTLGLAPIVVEVLLEAVRDMNRAGTTIVLVEQSLNVAASICERAIFIEKGTVAYEGATRDLLERPELTRAVLFGGHVNERID
jgi:ABC-type branched-subunit amino acid transport system ATPase component